MGRKSALTSEQWAEIERRILLEGETAYKLSAEFGVNESSIRRKINADKADKADKAIPKLRDMAVRKADAETVLREVDTEIAALPFSQQAVVKTLSDRLNNISNHLAGAAEYGAATSHRLNGLANARAALIPDVGTMDDNGRTAMAEIMALTKIANDASQIGLNLIRANKEQIEEQRQREKEAKASVQEFKASNSAEAAVVYQQMIGSGS